MTSVDLSARNRKLAALHTLKRQMALTDDLYRDKLEGITGQRSAKDCTDAQLNKALAMFHGKQKPNNPYTAKLKAFWIAAFNLGELADGGDPALDHFVLRQTGKERLAFITAAEANAVTEALKAICARAGFTPKGDGDDARRQLLEAQWARLAALGAVQIASPEALFGYVSKKYLACHGSTLNMDRAQLDDCARAFGRWIRRVQPRKAASA